MALFSTELQSNAVENEDFSRENRRRARSQGARCGRNEVSKRARLTSPGNTYPEPVKLQIPISFGQSKHQKIT